MKPLLIIVVVLVLAVGSWFLWLKPSHEPSVPADAPPLIPEPSAEPAERAAPPERPPIDRQPEINTEPVTQEPPPEPLPPLSQSDPRAMQALGELVGQQAAQEYFVNEALVAKAVATIDALASRQVPGNLMVVENPDTAFAAAPDEFPEKMILNETGDPVPQFQSSPENWKRYDPYVQILDGLDVSQVRETYERNKPLFDEAWAQLGYRDERFEDRVVEIIDELLATPEVEEPLQFKKPEAFYQFVDPELEALSAGQKALLRMGPENAATVKRKLRALRNELAGDAG